MKIWFFDNSTGLESANDLKTRARGGMVSSLVRIPNELAQLGFECRVYSDAKDETETEYGVKWLNCMTDDIPPADVLVCNRGTGPDGFLQFTARHRVLWTHDLPHAGFIPNPKIAAGFSRVVFMSRYAERVWRAMFPHIGKSVLIPNGVDKKMFYPRPKDMDYLIFGSAPNRGLNHLPLIYESLKSRCRHSLHMTAYTNIEIMHPRESRLQETDRFWDSKIPLQYKDCKEAGINVRDPLPQHLWAHEIGKAALMIMPSDYSEICSNNVLQSLASGTPVLTTGGIGSVGEWVKTWKNGYLSKWRRSDYMIHIVDLIRGGMRILNDERLHKKLMHNAVRTKHIYSWEQIGVKWAKMLKGL